jgi:hypothetical protein
MINRAMNSMPFTYLVGWSAHGVFYYGVRYADGCFPGQLWTSYFTSSKHVKAFRATYGEPDVVEVRRVFSEKNAAKNWEHSVLRRMRAKTSESFLNRTDNIGPPSTKGLKFSEERRARHAKIVSGSGNGMFGKRHTSHSKQQMSESWSKRDDHSNMGRAGEKHPMWGKSQKPHVIEALRLANLGAVKSDETKAKLRVKKLGTKWWNDGVVSRMAVECPGDGWARGRKTT